MAKWRSSFTGIKVKYPSKWQSFISKIERFIVGNFFPRRCYCCKCVDCQLSADGREYWYCLHLKADICSVCCWYDSLDPNWNWKECAFCSHDKDRERIPGELWEVGGCPPIQGDGSV